MTEIGRSRDAQVTDQPATILRDLRLPFREQIERARGVIEQCLTGRRDALGARGTLEESRPQLRFHALEGGARGGGRDPEGARGRAQAPVTRRLHEDAQVGHIFNSHLKVIVQRAALSRAPRLPKISSSSPHGCGAPRFAEEIRMSSHPSPHTIPTASIASAAALALIEAARLAAEKMGIEVATRHHRRGRSPESIRAKR